MNNTWNKYKVIEKSDITFLFLVLSFAFLNIFSSNLTRSLEHPVVSVFINIIYTAVYFAILYFVGFNISNIFQGLFVGAQMRVCPEDEHIGSPLLNIDYILIGIISIICIGIIGGILGILTIWYYGIFVLLIAVISRNFKTQSYPSIQLSWNWIFLACIIAIFVIFSIVDLMASLELNQSIGDVHMQQIHHLKAIIHNKSMVPNPFAFEIKIHEYYYPDLMVIPALLPSFIQSLPYINVGMTIFTVMVIFYGVLRIFNYRNIAILSTSLFILLIVSCWAYPSMTPLKCPMIFLLLFYSVTFIYILLFISKNNRIFFWIAVLSTGLLSGVTIVGSCLASTTFLIVVILYYKKQILSKSFFKAIIIIALLFILPKMINYYHSGTIFDQITNSYISELNIDNNLLDSGIHPEYYTSLDEYNLWINNEIAINHLDLGQKHKRNVHLLMFYIYVALFHYGGIFLIILCLLPLIFQDNKVFSLFFTIYNLQIVMLIIFANIICPRFTYYSFSWLVFAFAQILFLTIIKLKESVIFQPLNKFTQSKVINIIFIFLLCLFLLNNAWFSTNAARYFINIIQRCNFDYKGDYIHPFESSFNNKGSDFSGDPFKRELPLIERCIKNISLESGLTQLEHAKNYIQSERYAQIKSYFKPYEFVFEFTGENYFMIDLSGFYGYTTIYSTNILNNALYSDKPENVISTLKHLNIRYILIDINPLNKQLLPKPTLFERKFGGRFLNIVDIGPLFENVISPINFSNRGNNMSKRPVPVLLKVLYEESSRDNVEVMNLIDKLEFNEDPKLRAMLSTDVITDELIERMKNFYK